MRFLLLNITCSLLIIYEIMNAFYLVEQEGWVRILALSIFPDGVFLFWQLLLRFINIACAALLWARRKIGLFIYLGAGVVNLFLIELTHYLQFGELGRLRGATWVPLVIVGAIGVIYYRTLKPARPGEK